MDNSYEHSNGNGHTDNGHMVMRHSPYEHPIKASLPWLDLRVFYVRVSKCEIDDSTPECLTLNHIPLNLDTLLELNGVRISINSDGVSTLLRRDRLDKKSEEATFVSTDSIRMTGSLKFDVFDNHILMLSGVIELCNSKWIMNCESEITTSSGFLKGKQLASPKIEVYVAGSFMGIPIILTKTLQLSFWKKQPRKGMLGSIPEYEATEGMKDVPSRLALQASEHPNHKPENEDYSDLYSETEYLEGEDGELTWFNAGVRVGVGIGLGVCIGIGLGVGLLIRTYQGTTRNFRRRLL